MRVELRGRVDGDFTHGTVEILLISLGVFLSIQDDLPLATGQVPGGGLKGQARDLVTGGIRRGGLSRGRGHVGRGQAGQLQR